jgi:hypothetical protein
LSAANAGVNTITDGITAAINNKESEVVCIFIIKFTFGFPD